MNIYVSEAISYTVGCRQSKTALFDWIVFSTGFFWYFFLSSVELIYSCCARPRNGGGWCEEVLMLYGNRKSVGSSVLRAFSAGNACFPSDEPSSERVGGVELSRKPPKLRSWRYTQPRVAKATAGVAVVGKMASIPRAAAVV